MKQEIGFCTASDGVRVAYSRSGKGSPLVKTANWLNHLEYDWQSPVWRHWLEELTRGHELIRYDERGNGLSDWNVPEISFDAFVRDLEAVVAALGLERFPLLGLSQGCAVSIAYAVRYPERVSRLVLYGGYARGRLHRGPEDVEQARALLTLIRQGWGRDNPAFRQLFTSSFLPGGTPEQMSWFNELQRITTSADNAVRIREACDRIDVLSLLPRVSAPTLVVHCREDAVVPFDEGRKLAAAIPGARFLPLESRNHILLANEPAWQRFVSELRNFLGDEEDGRPSPRHETWESVDRLLAGALEQTRDRRAQWLGEACGGNDRMRREVERLLELAEADEDPLRPAGAMSGPVWEEVLGELERPVEPELRTGDRVGSYEIRELIGRGGMGKVFRAKHPVLERDVAVKALLDTVPPDGPSFRRFEREAKLLASLSHPNVALVYDFVVTEHQPYLVLELVEGETLADRLDRGPLPIAEALDVGSQIVEALHEAHSKGIVHRDLKPTNVKLTPEGRVKVLDFGLAKLSATGARDHSPEPSASYTTETGVVLGTPGYMSPEQTKGEAVDLRTDVWALGVLTYEMLTGERAFRGATLSETIASVLRDDVDWTRLPPDTSEALRDFMYRCLQKDPAARPRELKAEWSRVTAAESARATSPLDRLSRWWRHLGSS